MARKTYSVKLDEDLVEEADEAAKELKLNRNSLLERALIKYLAAPVYEKDVSISPSSRPGYRLAYICEKCPPPRPRVFSREGIPAPRCDTHGVMTIQDNNKYKGQKV